jgi:hypothetical protein
MKASVAHCITRLSTAVVFLGYTATRLLSLQSALRGIGLDSDLEDEYWIVDYR